MFEDERQASLMMMILSTKAANGRMILEKYQRTVLNFLSADPSVGPPPYRYVKLTYIAEITRRTNVREITIHVAQLRLVQRLTCNTVLVLSPVSSLTPATQATQGPKFGLSLLALPALRKAGNCALQDTQRMER